MIVIDIQGYLKYLNMRSLMGIIYIIIGKKKIRNQLNIMGFNFLAAPSWLVLNKDIAIPSQWLEMDHWLGKSVCILSTG